MEDDVIEEEDTIGDKSGIIREVVFILTENNRISASALPLHG